MSRVHDALRRAEQLGQRTRATLSPAARMPASAAREPLPLQGLLAQVRQVPYSPSRDALLIKSGGDLGVDAPVEEFRSLRTRLNHLQSLQTLHTLVVTSPSPAEGKTFTAANLAIAESHLKGNATLLADFDCRRPTAHVLFGLDRAPGITDYLMGKATLAECMRRIADLDLYVMTAGTPVANPLELLNLPEVRLLLERLPSVFNWVIIDTPPLLFAADANLLATYCDGTLLVVRLNATTGDMATRAIHGMSHNNLVGVVANAARRAELYSKYGYPYYYSRGRQTKVPEDTREEEIVEIVEESAAADGNRREEH